MPRLSCALLLALLAVASSSATSPAGPVVSVRPTSDVADTLSASTTTPTPSVGQRVTLQGTGVAFFNDTSATTVSSAGLALNMTVQFTNATGIEFALVTAIGQLGVLTVFSPYQVYQVTSGQVFFSYSGTLSIQASSFAIGTGTQYQLSLAGPSMFVYDNPGYHFLARLFGTLYNATTIIFLSFVVGNIPGDVNVDGQVNISDLASTGGSFGATRGQSRYDPYADTNMDGVVNLLDLVQVGANFGATY